MLPKTLIVSTPKHELKVDYYFGFISLDKVRIRKDFFSEMCKTGCRNYNQKYCCPPFSPDFNLHLKDCNELLVVLFKMNINQLLNTKYTEYHKLKISNAVLKPKIEKVMRILESCFGGKFLSTGACRLCKPCQRKMNKPCRHPDEMRYSLESLGVDCNKLSTDLFNLPLLWYKNKKAPEYTAVICALPLQYNAPKDDIVNRLCAELGN